MKNLSIILGIALAFGLTTWVMMVFLPFNKNVSTNQDNNANINLENIRSFEDCMNAGFAVMESYPRQCRTPDGRLFAEEIEVLPTYENASAEMIVVKTPHAGGVVGKEFIVTGEARGNWFFEASFPIEVVSMDGQILAGSIATAEGDWMTEGFVSFKSEIIDLPSAYIGPATLILRKDNPSGLPENDAAILIPIVVEY